MTGKIKFAAALLALFAAAELSTASAFARGGGGGSNLFNSPGYQRAQKESRERYLRSYYGQPYIKQPSVYPGRKWRHRGTRYRH